MKISSRWADRDQTLVRVSACNKKQVTFTGLLPRRDIVAFGTAARSRGHYSHTNVRVVGGTVHIEGCQLSANNTRILLVQLAKLLRKTGYMPRAEVDTYQEFATTSVFDPPPKLDAETAEEVAKWRARNKVFSHMEGGV